MKGFLKFLLLVAVEFVVGMAAVLVLSFIVTLLSQIAIGRLLMSIINDGYVSEVVTLISNCAAFFVCALLASKMNAFRPYRAMCIVAVIGAAYGIISGIIHGENFIASIIRLVISLVFFYKAKALIDE